MTSQVANKCLKLLEEPNGNSTIFLINPRGSKLLETIQSRGLTLRIKAERPQTSTSQWKTFIQNSAAQNLAEFIESNQKKDFDVSFWTQEWANWEAEQSDHLQSKEALVHWMKNLQEMETFHQPSATKWSLFYSVLKHHVFNRLSR